MNIFRRKLVIFSAAYILGGLRFSNALAQVYVEESQPQAAALGYKTDASGVDQSRYAKFSPGQSCGSCALYQGALGSYSGGCALFAGKQVMSNGWCSAYARAAGASSRPASRPLDPPPVAQAPESPKESPSLVDKATPQLQKNTGPNEQATKKCTRLGLSPGSDDYKLCVKSR